MKKILTTVAIVITIGSGATVAALVSQTPHKPANKPAVVTKPVSTPKPAQATTPTQPASAAATVQPSPKQIVTPQVVQVAKPATAVQLPAPEVPKQAPATETVTPTPEPAKTSACPSSTDKGAYYQRGTNPDGTPSCGFAYYNPCPYSEAVSASDPMCYKGQAK